MSTQPKFDKGKTPKVRDAHSNVSRNKVSGYRSGSYNALSSNHPPISFINDQQSGFTLLELMVAMAIFAMLAVAGWQVFDSVSRSKERAKLQLDVITELQYGYGQIQRDMLQATAYQVPNSEGNQGEQSTLSVSELNSPTNPAVAKKSYPATAAFQLNQNQLSFVRYADPDPRYAQSATLERIVYLFDKGNLIRQRYSNLDSNTQERPLESIVLKEVTSGQFQVLLPEPSSVFPDTDSAPNLEGGNRSQAQRPSLPNLQGNNNSSNDTNTDLEDAPPLLPKGVRVSFNSQLSGNDVPITWVYVLSKLPPATMTNNTELSDKGESKAPKGGAAEGDGESDGNGDAFKTTTNPEPEN